MRPHRRVPSSINVSFREPLYTDDEGKDHRIWDPVTDPKHIQVLQINHEVKMIPEPGTHRIKFWESLGLEDTKPFIPID